MSNAGRGKKIPKAAAPAALMTSKEALEERVDFVFKWIVGGNSQYEIEKAIKKKWPDERTMPLIIAAIKRIENSAELDPKVMAGWCVEAYRHVYRMSCEIGDMAAALRAITAIRGLAG